MKENFHLSLRELYYRPQHGNSNNASKNEFYAPSNLSNVIIIVICDVKDFLASLTLKALITIATDDIHKTFFHCFSEKIRLNTNSL